MGLVGTRRSVGFEIWMVALAVVALMASTCLAGAQMARVSVATGGGQANDHSSSPAISADGRYVAFTSQASNLVAGDGNGRQDVFRHDRQTGETERVNVTSGGVESNGWTYGCAISGDGRCVAFTSDASDLVAGDGNGTYDVFVHNCETGETARASVASDGTEGNGYSGSVAISADGRYIAFESAATNLVAGDTNGVADVFVHDTTTGETTRVSLSSYGMQITGDIERVAISGDGRYVAFGYNGADLAGDDTNADYDIFVHDCETGETECVSVTSSGTPGNDASSEPSVSADGRYVAFSSGASDLVAGDTNNAGDVFVSDRQTGQMERVSVTTSGLQANDGGNTPSISPDGSCVAFYSAASNLTPGDTNGFQDTFLHDRRTGRTERVSVGLGGVDSTFGGDWGAVSTGGRYVAFTSSSSNLIAGDTNGPGDDIFVCERPAAEFTADITSGLLPLTVNFTDLSTGEPTFWSWDFGDGTSDGGQSPSHTYSALGTYTVTLTAAGIYGSNTVTKADYVAVLEELAPVADFSADTALGYAPLTVTFTDLSTNSPTFWVWDFGDETFSEAQHPTHIYAAGPPYTVSLTAGNSGGSDTETKVDYIVAVATVAAAFSATPTMGMAPLDVAFTDESTGTVASWAWTFGDGGTSTAQHPTHQYASIGSYDVVLTVTNPLGSDTETKPDFIQVVAPVAAAFSVSNAAGVVPLVVSFSDESTGDPTGWAWEFGDGATSTDQGPTHTYGDPGYYTVTLTASTGVVADVEEKAGCIAAGFTDTPADFWAFHPILACATAHIVQGYWGNQYRPGEAVSRAQMSVYIARALAGGEEHVPDPSVGTPTFSDVGTDHWAYRYIEYCAGEDIVQGYPGGTYKPDAVVNRGQMAVYIARSIATPTGDVGVPEVPVETPPTFQDVTSGNEWAWCYKHVQYIAGLDIVQGYWDGNYHPEREVTRDQMAAYVQRAFELPVYGP